MKLLVKWDDVVANLKNNDSQTPLALAAMSGNKVVVKLLVKQDDVVANLKDKYSQMS